VRSLVLMFALILVTVVVLVAEVLRA